MKLRAYGFRILPVVLVVLLAPAALSGCLFGNNSNNEVPIQQARDEPNARISIRRDDLIHFIGATPQEVMDVFGPPSSGSRVGQNLIYPGSGEPGVIFSFQDSDVVNNIDLMSSDWTIFGIRTINSKVRIDRVMNSFEAVKSAPVTDPETEETSYFYNFTHDDLEYTFVFTSHPDGNTIFVEAKEIFPDENIEDTDDTDDQPGNLDMSLYDPTETSSLLVSGLRELGFDGALMIGLTEDDTMELFGHPDFYETAENMSADAKDMIRAWEGQNWVLRDKVNWGYGEYGMSVILERFSFQEVHVLRSVFAETDDIPIYNIRVGDDMETSVDYLIENFDFNIIEELSASLSNDIGKYILAGTIGEQSRYFALVADPDRTESITAIRLWLHFTA